MGARIYSQQDYPYITPVQLDQAAINRGYSDDPTGVYTNDEYCNIDLRPKYDQIQRSHMSYNRNFDGYKGYTQFNVNDLEQAYSEFSVLFFKELISKAKKDKDYQDKNNKMRAVISTLSSPRVATTKGSAREKLIRVVTSRTGLRPNTSLTRQNLPKRPPPDRSL